MNERVEAALKGAGMSKRMTTRRARKAREYVLITRHLARIQKILSEMKGAGDE